MIKTIGWMLGWGFVAFAHAQGGAVIQGVDNDPQNRIWNCDTNRAKFGDASFDKSRCITFRYAVPPGGVRSATLHLAVTVMEAATDWVVMGVAKPFPSCAWAAGPMPCVALIGGPLPTGEILDIDLSRFPGPPGTKDPPEARQAVAAQLNTGVVHVLVQDDTAVHCAQLVLNGGTGQALCTRANPGAAVPVAKAPPPPIPPAQIAQSGGASFVGCFKDQGDPAGTQGRDLNGSMSSNASMTAQLCVSECRAKGFAYAATQHGSQCFCGNSYGKSGPANNCNIKCAGNPNEICGGAWANSVYGTGLTKPGAAGPVASPGTGASPGTLPTGDSRPMPPFGTPEPNRGVAGMTIQGGQRRVIANQRVTVPIWLIDSQGLANMNVEVYYDVNVVRQEGDIGRGKLLANALVSTNPKVQGVLRAAFAQTSGVNGTGTMLNVPFRAIGQPGQSTRLHLVVTTLNTPDGRVPAIYRIPGEITILDKDGRIPGPVGPGGSGPGTGGPGGPAAGGPGTGGPGTGGAGTGTPGTGGTAAPAGLCEADGRFAAIHARCALEMSVRLIPAHITLDLDNNRDVTSRDAVLILQRATGR